MHLLISEVAVAPDTSEFVEVHNPTSQHAPLDRYYLSDNATYHRLARNEDFQPDSVTSDFLVRFPDGATLGPGQTAVVQLGTDVFQSFGACPDFAVTDVECDQTAVATMTVPERGHLGTAGSLLGNANEMVVLFRIDSETGVVDDVDYLSWGETFDDTSRIDKTGVAGYHLDTARGDQRASVSPDAHESVRRCSDAEADELQQGGNGLLGHDETSEDMSSAFVLTTGPNPGVFGCR